MSAAPVDEVPAGVVTVTSIVPVLPAGETAVKLVEELKVTLNAADVPNLTVAPETKLVPVIVTEVLPVVGPEFGETAVTVGTPRYVN